MGNDQCKDCAQSSLQTHAYGTHEVLHQSTSIMAIVQKKVQKDPRLQQTVTKQLQMRKKMQHPHIVKLQKYEIKQEQYGFKVTMYYEYIPKTLRDRIEELKTLAKEFTERELFAVLYGVQEALFKLNQMEIRHSCINFDTIMCKNNFYKITDVSSTTYLTSYDLTSKGSREQFLSQKLLDHISHKSLNPTYELKDDLFSLGMVVLALSSGKKATDFYSWNEKGAGFLNVRNIDIALKAIERKYSSRLVKKIKLLIFDPDSSEDSFSRTNITDQLQELDDHMNRVMSKAKKLNSTTISYSE